MAPQHDAQYKYTRARKNMGRALLSRCVTVADAGRGLPLLSDATGCLPRAFSSTHGLLLSCSKSMNPALPALLEMAYSVLMTFHHVRVSWLSSIGSSSLVLLERSLGSTLERARTRIGCINDASHCLQCVDYTTTSDTRSVPQHYR